MGHDSGFQRYQAISAWNVIHMFAYWRVVRIWDQARINQMFTNYINMDQPCISGGWDWNMSGLAPAT